MWPRLAGKLPNHTYKIIDSVAVNHLEYTILVNIMPSVSARVAAKSQVNFKVTPSFVPPLQTKSERSTNKVFSF